MSLHFRNAVLTTAAAFPWLVPPHVTPDSLDLVGGRMLADGDCGHFVFFFGREFARKVLVAIESLEDFDCCVALRDAIEYGTSVTDGQGEVGRNFYTPACAERMAAWAADGAGVASAQASTPVAVSAQPCELELEMADALAKTYRHHGDTLPAGILGEEYLGFGVDNRPVDFGPQAHALRWGLAGFVVAELGREFCGHLLPHLEAMQQFELAQVVRVAVEEGESLWDELGHLPADSPKTNLPSANGTHDYLRVGVT